MGRLILNSDGVNFAWEYDVLCFEDVELGCWIRMIWVGTPGEDRYTVERRFTMKATGPGTGNGDVAAFIAPFLSTYNRHSDGIVASTPQARVIGQTQD